MVGNRPKIVKTTNLYNLSVLVAICMEEVIAFRIKEGGYDNWSFKNFIGDLISTLK